MGRKAFYFFVIFCLGAVSAKADPTPRTLDRVKAILADTRLDLQQGDAKSWDYLRQYAYDEVAHALIIRLRLEFSKALRGEHGRVHTGVIRSCLVGLSEMATRQYQAEIKELAVMAEQSFLGKDVPFSETRASWYRDYIEPRMSLAVRRSRYRTKALPSLLEIDPSVADSAGAYHDLLGEDRWDIRDQKKFDAELKRIADIRAYMEARLIDQAEVIDLWEKYLVRNLVQKHLGKEKPDYMYLMGHPGTGKDTSVIVALAAIHKNPKAYQDHMFRMPLVQAREDLMQVTGSTQGLVGSGQLSPLIRFAVKHSGGRYKIEAFAKNGETRYAVMANPNWKEGMDPPPGYFRPTEAVLFINEYHNWSKAAKDQFTKEFIETGRLTIGDPGPGLHEIFVPLTTVFATNEGIELLSPREDNGARYGQAPTFPELIARHDLKRDDEEAKKECLVRGRSAANGPQESAEKSTGMSEENANRIAAHALILMRPTSPQGLQQIVRIKLQVLADGYDDKRSALGVIELEATDALVSFIQKFNYHPEDMARPMDSRIFSAVESTLLDLIQRREIKAEPAKQRQILIDVVEKADGTADLLLTSSSFASGSQHIPLKMTAGRRAPQPVSDEEISRLARIPEQMGQELFGINPVLQWLGRSLLARADEFAQVGRQAKSEFPTLALAFFGISSAGKTQSARVLSKQLFNDDKHLVEIGLGNVQTMADLERLIFGGYDAFGNSVPSSFMKEYKRLDGKMVLVLDEFTNMPQILQRAFYDFLREPNVNFGGRPLAMGGIVTILTGNLGEEWYTDIPKNIPESEAITAYAQVFARATASPGFLYETLSRKLNDAIIKRIGPTNIFFYPPLSFAAIRQLTQFFLGKSLERIKGSASVRGWQVGFANVGDHEKLVEDLENEAFTISSQGAGIEQYVNRYFYESLKVLLLQAQIPHGQRVILRTGVHTESTYRLAGDLNIEVWVEGRAEPLTLKLQRKLQEEKARGREMDQLLTTAHEVLHNFMRHALFPGAYEDTRLTVIPGVENIDNHWIRYLGLASHVEKVRSELTREVVLRQMAVLLAGSLAQEMITQGAQHDAGKGNDIQRASQLATLAIVQWGLSEKWGYQAAPEPDDVAGFIARLSLARKELLENEVDLMIREARDLGRRWAEANFTNVILPFYLALGEAGELTPEWIKDFYATHPIVSPPEAVAERPVVGLVKKLSQGVARGWKKVFARPAPPRPADGILKAEIPRPAQVANIEDIIRGHRQKALATVPTVSNVPIILDGMPCRKILEAERP